MTAHHAQGLLRPRGPLPAPQQATVEQRIRMVATGVVITVALSVGLAEAAHACSPVGDATIAFSGEAIARNGDTVVFHPAEPAKRGPHTFGPIPPVPAAGEPIAVRYLDEGSRARIEVGSTYAVTARFGGDKSWGSTAEAFLPDHPMPFVNGSSCGPEQPAPAGTTRLDGSSLEPLWRYTVRVAWSYRWYGLTAAAAAGCGGLLRTLRNRRRRKPGAGNV